MPIHNADDSAVTSAWILNDAGGTAALSAALEQKQFAVSRTVDIDVLHSATSVQLVLDEVKANPPAVLWLNVPAHVHSWTGKASKRLAIMLSAMCFYQLTELRHVVVEGAPASLRGWHTSHFDKVLKHPRVSTSQIRWCALGVSDANQLPVCNYSRLLTTYPIPPSATLCCKSPVASKLRRFPVNMWQQYYSSLADLTVSQVFPSNVVKKTKKHKEKVTFIDDVDGPGEHAD